MMFFFWHQDVEFQLAEIGMHTVHHDLTRYFHGWKHIGNTCNLLLQKTTAPVEFVDELTGLISEAGHQLAPYF